MIGQVSSCWVSQYEMHENVFRENTFNQRVSRLGLPQDVCLLSIADHKRRHSQSYPPKK